MPEKNLKLGLPIRVSAAKVNTHVVISRLSPPHVVRFQTFRQSGVFKQYTISSCESVSKMSFDIKKRNTFNVQPMARSIQLTLMGTTMGGEAATSTYSVVDVPLRVRCLTLL